MLPDYGIDRRRKPEEAPVRAFKGLIQEASPGAAAALGNGLFNTDFPPDGPVSFPNRESVTRDLRRIVSGMIIRIAGEFFSIEAQTDGDLNMALRMFRYGCRGAVPRPETGEDRSLTITSPQARVLYRETTRRTPGNVMPGVVFRTGAGIDCTVPAFKALDHGPGNLRG